MAWLSVSFWLHHLRKYVIVNIPEIGCLIMVALWNRAHHYIFMLWFVLLLLLFFLA